MFCELLGFDVGGSLVVLFFVGMGCCLECLCFCVFWASCVCACSASCTIGCVLGLFLVVLLRAGSVGCFRRFVGAS